MFPRLIAPKRGEKLIGALGAASERLSSFFEEIARLCLTKESVGNVTDVVQADATAATAAYDQAQAQSAVDLSNANKSKINEILTALKNGNIMEVP